MKKLVNALDRIAGLVFFAVFACGACAIWKLGGPFGHVTTQVHAVAGVLVFICGLGLDTAAGCWYFYAWSHNGQKLTRALLDMAKSLVIVRNIYNWLTAD